MNVQKIARKGRSILVEWADDEGQHRSYVPYDSVFDIQGQSVCELADLGIPYGVPWELLAHQLPAIDGTELQKELRRLGIWTYDDLRKNPAVGLNAICQARIPTTVVDVPLVDVGQLLKLAAAYLQGVSHG